MIDADYFGAAAQACLDHLRASKQVLARKHIAAGKLLLTGWSQGGAVTNTFLQRLEREQLPVAATVTASGPVDLVSFMSKPINDALPFLSPAFQELLS